MKKWMTLLLAIGMLGSLASCAGEQGEQESGTGTVEEGVLRVAALHDMTTMDVTQTTDDYMVPMNVFDRLFEVEVGHDGSSEIVGSLCESYTVSDDGREYHFRLREGVVFSNGSALTAEDVRYTFERLLTAGGVNDDVPMEVLGAQALKDGETEHLAGFTVLDELEFSITLTAPNAGFLAELTVPALSIVDAETMEQAEQFGVSCADTVGTGPYCITEWAVNDHYTLQYNPLYWGEEPSVKRVIVSIIPDASTQNLLYRSGELDLLDLETLDTAIVESTYQTTYADRLISTPRVGLTYLALNAEQEFLSDVRVRQAVQRAVDVESIVATVYGGNATVENGIIPSGVWGHNDALQRADGGAEEAKQLLAAAGYAEGEVTMELAMDSSSSATTQLIYQTVQQQLKAAGINATIRSYDESAWLEVRKSGKMEAFIATWTMDYNDPANIMATFFGSEEKTALRSLNYADAEVMARVSAAAAITDEEQRRGEYQELERKIVQEDAAWVPLVSSRHLFALGERVESFTPYWAGYSNFYAKDVQLR